MHEWCLKEYSEKSIAGNKCPQCKKYIVFSEEGEYEYKGEMYNKMKFFYMHENDIDEELKNFVFSSN